LLTKARLTVIPAQYVRHDRRRDVKAEFDWMHLMKHDAVIEHASCETPRTRSRPAPGGSSQIRWEKWTAGRSGQAQSSSGC